MMITFLSDRSTGSGTVRPGMRALGLGVAVVTAGLVLSGCQQTRVSAFHDDYRTRHPIILKEAPHTLDIPVGLTSSHLGRVDRDKIAGFARSAHARGDGAIDILVPSGSANEQAAYHMAGKIRRIVDRAGASSVTVRAYGVADPATVAPIRLAYAAVRATVHPCGVWPDTIAGNFNQNRDYWEFGCSTQGNLAQMVSNPSDLISPRTMTAADQERRGTVFDKYRTGDATASESEQGSANVASVGGS